MKWTKKDFRVITDRAQFHIKDSRYKAFFYNLKPIPCNLQCINDFGQGASGVMLRINRDITYP